jgi:hypothetical protein
MELSFKEWAKEYDESISLKSALQAQPWLMDIFHTRGLPNDIKAWVQGYRNGQQSGRNPNFTLKDNPYLDRTGQIAVGAEDYSDGWIFGFNSIRQKQA